MLRLPIFAFAASLLVANVTANAQTARLEARGVQSRYTRRTRPCHRQRNAPSRPLSPSRAVCSIARQAADGRGDLGCQRGRCRSAARAVLGAGVGYASFGREAGVAQCCVARRRFARRPARRMAWLLGRRHAVAAAMFGRRCAACGPVPHARYALCRGRGAAARATGRRSGRACDPTALSPIARAGRKWRCSKRRRGCAKPNSRPPKRCPRASSCARARVSASAERRISTPQPKAGPPARGAMHSACFLKKVVFEGDGGRCRD